MQESFDDPQAFQQNSIELICEVAHKEYNRVPALLRDVLVDASALYEGRWPTHEACQVGYHNIGHALDVTLAVARMTAGWNKVNPRQPITEEIFLAGMIAGIFHDSGYIKEKGDQQGRGGKYTFSHVERSIKMVGRYMEENNMPGAIREMVPGMIALTEFYHNPEELEPLDIPLEEVMARMVAAADLIAQMADVDYLERIKDLFDEFVEGYRFEKPEVLAGRGVQVFKSARELIDGTKSFYENFVQPRLKALGGMDKYLTAFFGDDRNPYQENITANLSDQFADTRTRWQRFGEVLEQLNVATHEQIVNAIGQQQTQDGEMYAQRTIAPASVNRRLLEWINQRFSTERLGEILMERENIEPKDLCRALLAQILPRELLKSLSREEMFFLLSVALLLQNYQKGSQVFTTVLEMANELLNCEASSILLADNETREIVIAVPTGPRSSALEGKRLPMDKGLAGWVFRHGQSVCVKNVRQDNRFNQLMDESSDFRTRSILAVPFHINGKRVGVIELLNKNDDEFTERDKDILALLVNVIGSALSNILLA